VNNIVKTDPSNFLVIRQLDKFMIGHKGCIAGGVFKNIFNNEKFKDVDVFFRNEKDFEEARKYFTDNDEYKFAYKNDKVLAYLHCPTNIIVELIRYTYSKPINLIKEFDFTITKFVYYKTEVNDEVIWKVAFHYQFFEHLHMKRLVIDQDIKDISKPVNTFNRMFRYAKYGYQPCRETKSKMIEALRNMSSFKDEDLSMELYNGLD